MALLIYSAITSLDGYIEDEHGSFDWAAPDEEVFAFVNDLVRPVGTYLYGRRMYETMVYWETAQTLANQTHVEQDFTTIWQAADKIVYSRTLQTVASARTRIELDFDIEAIRQMKATAERDITVGGSVLAAQAIRAGLVDEIHLFLTPVVIGGGKPSLPNKIGLHLEAARRAPLQPWRRVSPVSHKDVIVRHSDQGCSSHSLHGMRCRTNSCPALIKDGVARAQGVTHAPGSRKQQHVEPRPCIVAVAYCERPKRLHDYASCTTLLEPALAMALASHECLGTLCPHSVPAASVLAQSGALFFFVEPFSHKLLDQCLVAGVALGGQGFGTRDHVRAKANGHGRGTRAGRGRPLVAFTWDGFCRSQHLRAKAVRRPEPMLFFLIGKGRDILAFYRDQLVVSGNHHCPFPR
jgi:dihydrofolate reductase